MTTETDRPSAEAKAGGSPQEPQTPVWKTVLRIFAFIVVPLGFVIFLAIGLSTGVGPTIGSDAPEFTLPDLQGNAVSSRELQGSPVVVNFWASWCIPCKDEAPILQAAWERYSDSGIVVLGINVQDSANDAKAFVETHGLTFPSVRDVNGDVGLDFGLKGIPETFFIDHTYRFSGFGAGEEIGSRGSLVVRGAVSPILLNDQIELLLERWGEDRS